MPLGVETIVWLDLGCSASRDTDGARRRIAQYLAGKFVLLAPDDPPDSDHASDARGRAD